MTHRFIVFGRINENRKCLKIKKGIFYLKKFLFKIRNSLRDL